MPEPPAPIGLRADVHPLHVSDVCTRCNAEINGWLYVDAHLAVVDSVEFMLVGGKPVCDSCCGHTSDGQ